MPRRPDIQSKHTFSVIDTLSARLAACANHGMAPQAGDLLIAARRLAFLQSICPHRNRVAAAGMAPCCEDCGAVLGELDRKHAAERLARLRDHQNEQED